MKGKDSNIAFAGNECIAVFGEGYRQRLASLGLEGHLVLRRAQSPCFIEFSKCSSTQLRMRRMDFTVGKAGGVSARALAKVGKEKLIDWLLKLSDELSRVGVCHHDVHPGNIMYSKSDRTFRLIDFGWASLGEFAGEFNTARGTPLNPQYGTDDQTAIATLIQDLRRFDGIRSMLLPIGRTYRDGSSSKPGRPYHLIAFPEFDDVAPVSPSKSARHCYKYLQKDIQADFRDHPPVVDLGCASGYMSFRIRKFAPEVFAVDSDADVTSLNAALCEYKRIHNVHFECADIADVEVPPHSVCLLLNVHHWIWKRGGRKACELLLRRIKASRLYFMTADKDSVAKFTLPLSSMEVRSHLKSCGWEPRRIKFDSMRRRTLFACERIAE